MKSVRAEQVARAEGDNDGKVNKLKLKLCILGILGRSLVSGGHDFQAPIPPRKDA